MLRLVQPGNALPTQFPVDPDAIFEPGQIGQLGVMGQTIVCGVSDGTIPIGILDDIKTVAFTAPAIDEDVRVQAVGVVDPNTNKLVSAVDVAKQLKNPNIVPSSFTTNPVDVELVERNGVVIFPAGTELNFDMDGDGIADAFQTTVSYSYQIPNVPGDDSTQPSGKVTIWFQRMIAITDKFETNQRYPVGANLFVSESGLLTTRQVSAEHPGIALVTGPPTSIFRSLEFMWL